jgi:sugar phosphate isomerase/epimerase
MFRPPLGISLWSTNHLLAPEVRHAIETGDIPSDKIREGVRSYFNQIADFVLASNELTVELWPNPILSSDLAAEGLARLSEARRISSMHAPFRDLSALDENERKESVQAHIEAAKFIAKLGGNILVIHGSAHFQDEVELPQRSRLSAQSIAELADACGELGVKIAIELLSPPLVGHSAALILYLLAQADRPNIGVCIDVNHIFPPSRIVPTVRLLGPKILTLHISDYDGTVERHWLPKQGVIDWHALIMALNDVNYAGAFVYEVCFDAPSVAEGVQIIKRNYQTLMEML